MADVALSSPKALARMPFVRTGPVGEDVLWMKLIWPVPAEVPPRPGARNVTVEPALRTRPPLVGPAKNSDAVCVAPGMTSTVEPVLATRLITPIVSVEEAELLPLKT